MMPFLPGNPSMANEIFPDQPSASGSGLTAEDLAFFVDRRVVASVENQNLLFQSGSHPGDADGSRRLLRVTPPWRVIEQGRPITTSAECPPLTGLAHPGEAERWEAWCSRLACLDRNTVRGIVIDVHPCMLRLHLDGDVVLEARVANCMPGFLIRTGKAEPGISANPRG